MADQPTLNRLLDWFKTNGGHVDDAISLKFNDDFGCHFVATNELGNHTKACTCPFGLTISYLNCLKSPPKNVRSEASSTVCSPLVGKIAPNAVGAFFLAEQRLKGKESFWYPYVDSLPKDGDLTTPLWFQQEDLVWLQGTNLYSTAVPPAQTAVGLRLTMYQEAWKTGISVLKENGIDTTPYTWELCLWAATIFSSRSFTSNIMTQSTKDTFPLLYPVIDCFNHRFGEKAHWNMESGSFSLIFPDGAPKGQQLFNNYAPKGNEELLMGYGFCLPNNPCDQVALRLAKPPPQIHAALRTRLPTHFSSTEWTLEQSSFYIRGSSHYTGGYPNPFGLACLRGVPAELTLALQTLVSFGYESAYPEGPERQAELWWATLDALLARLQQKRAAIGDVEGHPVWKKQEFAKVYRDGQVKILEEVIGELENTLQPLESEEVSALEVFGKVDAVDE